MFKKLNSFLICLVACSTQISAFTDVPVGDWRYPYVESAVSSGLITGYEDNTFRPDNQVTLAEFCVLLSNAYYGTSLVNVDETEFEHWWEPYLYTCYLRDGLKDTVVGNQVADYLEKGYRFNKWDSYANLPLSRYDVAAMLKNLLADRYETIITDPSAYQQTISDVSSDSPYSNSVATVYHYGFLQGNNLGLFLGDNTLSRGEAAVIINALTKSSHLTTELRSEGAGILVSPAYTLSDYNLTGNLEIENYVFARVNELRDSLGLNILTSNSTLVEYAYIRAKESEINWAHQRPDGTPWNTVIFEEDRKNLLTGENLTMGSGFQPYEYADMIFKSWLNSPSHYSNMISPNHVELGLAVYVTESGSYYAAQIFGKPLWEVEDLFPNLNLNDDFSEEVQEETPENLEASAV